MQNLPPGLTSHIAGLKSFAKTYTSSALARERSREQLRAVVRKLSVVADSEMEKFESSLTAVDVEARKQFTPVCTMGCSHCCHQLVAAPVPTVFAIVDYARENMGNEDLEALRRRVRLYKRNMLSFRNGRISQARVPCPLLVSDLCTIHPSRPLVCKSFNSLDVSICQWNHSNPQEHREVPQVFNQAATVRALEAGMREGLRERGLDGDLVELGLALEVVMDQPDAPEAYLAGKNPFSECKRGLLQDIPSFWLTDGPPSQK